MNVSLSPKVMYTILAVVVVVAAALLYKAADTNPKTPLPDPNMFKAKQTQSSP